MTGEHNTSIQTWKFMLSEVLHLDVKYVPQSNQQDLARLLKSSLVRKNGYKSSTDDTFDSTDHYRTTSARCSPPRAPAAKLEA